MTSSTLVHIAQKGTKAAILALLGAYLALSSMEALK